MVAQFPQTTTPAKNLTPQIKVDVKTFNERIAQFSTAQTNYKMCAVNIVVSNIKNNLAIATFSRIFIYAQSLANNDINPTPNVNTNVVDSEANLFQAQPPTGITLSIDSTEAISTCVLILNVNNLKLNYMDEYFNSRLTYLTNANANDLNP